MAETHTPARSEQVTYGGALLLAGGLAGRLLLYGVNIILARALSVTELGLYFLGLGVVQALSVIGALGIDVGLMRFAPRYEAQGRWDRLDAALQGGLLACLVTTSILSSLLFLSADLIAGALHRLELATPLRVAAWVLPALVLHRIVTNLFQGLFRVSTSLFLRHLIYPVLFVLLAWLLLRRSPTAQAALAAQGLAAGLPVLIGIGLLRRLGLLRPSLSLPEDAPGELLRFSAPLMGAGIIGFVALWLDSFLVSVLIDAPALGLYGIVFRISLIGTLLLEAFNGALGPAAASIVSRDGGGLETLYRDVTRLVLILFLPLFGVMLVFPEALLGLFGAAFRGPEAASALRILALGQLVNVAVGGAGMLLVMAGQSWLNMLNGFGMLALNVGLCFALIPQYGIVGAAVASAVAVAAINIGRLLEVRMLLDVQPVDLRWWKPALALAVATGSGMLVRQNLLLNAWVGIAALGLIYGTMLLALGLEPAELALLRRLTGGKALGGRGSE